MIGRDAKNGKLVYEELLRSSPETLEALEIELELGLAEMQFYDDVQEEALIGIPMEKRVYFVMCTMTKLMLDMVKIDGKQN
jgi:hypothetical protein